MDPRIAERYEGDNVGEVMRAVWPTRPVFGFFVRPVGVVCASATDVSEGSLLEGEGFLADPLVEIVSGEGEEVWRGSCCEGATKEASFGKDFLATALRIPVRPMVNVARVLISGVGVSDSVFLAFELVPGVGSEVDGVLEIEA